MPMMLKVATIAVAATLLKPLAEGAFAQPIVTLNAPEWRIDKGHSVLEFSIRHYMSRVKGTFREWHGTVAMADPARWEAALVEVIIGSGSIFTNHDRRDADLRSNDFFAADSFPTIRFKSARIEREGDEGTIHGILTIRGRSQPVALRGRVLGFQKTIAGGVTTERIAFEAETTINRLDYGVSWNRAVEGGGLLLSDEVRIEVAVQAIRQTGAAPAGGR